MEVEIVEEPAATQYIPAESVATEPASSETASAEPDSEDASEEAETAVPEEGAEVAAATEDEGPLALGTAAEALTESEKAENETVPADVAESASAAAAVVANDTEDDVAVEEEAEGAADAPATAEETAVTSESTPEEEVAKETVPTATDPTEKAATDAISEEVVDDSVKDIEAPVTIEPSETSNPVEAAETTAPAAAETPAIAVDPPVDDAPPVNDVAMDTNAKDDAEIEYLTVSSQGSSVVALDEPMETESLCSISTATLASTLDHSGANGVVAAVGADTTTTAAAVAVTAAAAIPEIKTTPPALATDAVASDQPIPALPVVKNILDGIEQPVKELTSDVKVASVRSVSLRGFPEDYTVDDVEDFCSTYGIVTKVREN